jgi:hypothetical protein
LVAKATLARYASEVLNCQQCCSTWAHHQSKVAAFEAYFDVVFFTIHRHGALGTKGCGQSGQELAGCLAHQCGVNFYLFARFARFTWLTWLTNWAVVIACAAFRTSLWLTALAGLFPAGTALSGFAAWACGLYACAHASLAASTSKEALLGLINDFELCVVFGNTQLVKCCFFCFF